MRFYSVPSTGGETTPVCEESGRHGVPGRTRAARRRMDRSGRGGSPQLPAGKLGLISRATWTRDGHPPRGVLEYLCKTLILIPRRCGRHVPAGRVAVAVTAGDVFPASGRPSVRAKVRARCGRLTSRPGGEG